MSNGPLFMMDACSKLCIATNKSIRKRYNALAFLCLLKNINKNAKTMVAKELYNGMFLCWCIFIGEIQDLETQNYSNNCPPENEVVVI
jgi:hypothetical protein